MYSSENPVFSATFSINSLSYNFIPNFSAISFPTYLPPEPYSLDTVITTCFDSLLSVLVSSGSASLFIFVCFKCFTSIINNVDAIINASKSANGPANNTPLIPNILLNIIIAGIKNNICLDNDSIALLLLFPIAWKNIPDGICIPLNIVSIK